VRGARLARGRDAFRHAAALTPAGRAV